MCLHAEEKHYGQRIDHMVDNSNITNSINLKNKPQIVMQLQIERNLVLNWKSSIERTFINWNTLSYFYLTTKLALVFYWQRQEHHQSYGTIFPARCRQRDVQGPLSRINAISFNEQFLVAIYVISSVFMSIVCKNSEGKYWLNCCQD